MTKQNISSSNLIEKLNQISSVNKRHLIFNGVNCFLVPFNHILEPELGKIATFIANKLRALSHPTRLLKDISRI
jgi:hypothetical protein